MRRLWLFLFAGLLACPAPVIPGDDGGSADAGTFVTDACLTLPAQPEAPRLTDWTCPAGWEAVDAHAVTPVELANGYAPAVKACAPPALPTSCPAGQRPALGSQSCVPVGAPCPAGDFPPGLTGTVYYVKAGASGNGLSPSTPMGTIAAALAAAPAGSTIAVARGTYTEYVPVIRAITLQGACAQETIIAAPSRSATRGTIDVGAAATIKDLKVTGPRPGVWASFNPDFARLEGVIVEAAELAGVFVSDSGKLELLDVLVTGTLADPTDNTMGRGLQVRSGGQVRGARVVVEKNRDVGVTLDGAGCSAELSELIVRDTQSETASRAFGLGMEVRYGARAVLARALFERNRNSALVSDKAGSRLTLTDVVLQDTLPQENNSQYGGGLELSAGVTADATRLFIRRNRATGIRLGGAAFTATDLAVTGTEARANDATQGLGLVMDTLATATLTRAVFAHNRIADLFVAGQGTRLTVDDARLYGARVQGSDGKWGMGFIAIDQAALTANRLAIEHTDDLGGQVQGRSVATLTDLSIRDTGFGGPQVAGDGLAVQSGAQAIITRAAFKANRRIAVGAHTGAVVQLADLTVSDMGTDLNGLFGRGVVAQSGAIVSVLRADFARAREAALYAYGAGTRLYVDAARVTDTQASITFVQEGRALSVEAGAAAEVTCLFARGNREVAVNVTNSASQLLLRRSALVETTGVSVFGDGIAASGEATVTVEDCEIEGNQNLGLAFAGAQGVVRRTRIATNAVGIYAGEGSTTREVAEAQAIVPLEVQVEESCTFEGNRTRVSGDYVPLPGTAGATPDKPDF